MNDSRHAPWIQRCLDLAAQGQSRVSPNPLVGAVLLHPNETVLGEGWHDQYGADHAERIAIQEALKRHSAEAVAEATLYVNLEPCGHDGKTPPCTQLILRHGIRNVVAGMADPNPRAAGGAAFLRSRGVNVTVGVLRNACRRLNEAFLHGLRSSRPLITLKIAQTVDGRVATPTGHSQWISGKAARRMVHAWRAESDGILVGSGTARADDPSLTVRHVAGPNPHRFVLDGQGALPQNLKLFTDGQPTTAIVGPSATPGYKKALLRHGGQLIRSPLCGKHLGLRQVAEKLPVHSLLVEAGSALASALLKDNLVDRLFIFVAPKILGCGTPSVDQLYRETVHEALQFAEHQWEAVGPDMLLRGYFRKLS